jgi:hypothetical protein
MTYDISVDLFRAAKRSEGETSQWVDERIQQAVERYTKFFALMADDPNRVVAPTSDIDAIWHLHMLAPQAYYDDCIAACGQIIGHDGGFGSTAEELPQLINTFERTGELWLEKYGERYVEQPNAEATTKCWHNCQSRCHNACKSVAVQA